MVDVFVFFSDGSGAIGSRVGLRIRRCAGTSQSAGPFWVLALTHIAVSFRTSDDLDYFFLVIFNKFGHASKDRDFMRFQGWEKQSVMMRDAFEIVENEGRRTNFTHFRQYRMNRTSILDNLCL